jgi:YfiH family protein
MAGRDLGPIKEVGFAMSLTQTPLGYELRTPRYLVFFGGINAQLPAIKTAYPELEFVRLKQIHSDAILESDSTAYDLGRHGDAHYSLKSGLGLCVITADCIPAFLYHAETGFVAGIHAGWRGVANKIVPKTIERLKHKGADPSELQVIIGPHIQKKSFEVDVDVKDQILQSVGPKGYSSDLLLYEKKENQKYLVDLSEVLKAQLIAENVPLENVFTLHIDTVSSPDFHSYRRDKDKSGRQISFIAKA